MWGAKANRIADLEARLAVAQRNRQPIDDGSHDTIRALRDQLAKTKRDLRDTETQLGEKRRQIDTLIARLGEYADAGIANGERAQRYRTAWLSARRRAKAYGDGLLRLGEEPDQYQTWVYLKEAQS